MDGEACDLYLGGGSVEILIFNLSDLTAVHCVGKISADLSQIDVVHTLSNLLIGGEAKSDGTVGNLWVGQQVLGSGHNLRHACFVIAAKERCPVGDNQIFSTVLPETWELLRTHDNVSFFI